MMFKTVTLLSATLATLAGAWTTPVGNPSGNPISSPTLGEIVPVGKPYNIKWNPTSTGTVTILLLRGPSTNVVPLYAIAEKIDNSGSYSWTPSTSLEADTSRYGIQLIQDKDGVFQYSTQFGISGGSGTSSSSSSSASGSSTYASSTTKTVPSGSPPYSANCTSVCTKTNSTVSPSVTVSARPTPSSNGTTTAVTTVSPSTSGSASSTVRPSATGSAPATTQSANAAMSQFGSSTGTLSSVVFVAGGILAAWFI
ncbi:MAG: UDP-glucose-4-epimerase [Watsoniomyces obsoletus]|nr:MAG: UDP-glucose-4-epimerase [Watsoniomyces obsoletus]